METIFVAIAVTAGISAFGCMVGAVVCNTSKGMAFLAGGVALGLVSGLASSQALKIDNAPAQPQQAIVQHGYAPVNG